MEGQSGNREQLEKTCRICFDTDASMLISACKCSGSLMYSHESCLETWIKTKYEKISQAQCEICKHFYKFKLRTKRQWQSISDEDKKCRFQFNITILIFFYAVLGIVSIIAGVFYIDLKKKFVYSVLILVSIALPIVILTLLTVKLIISNFLVTKILYWKIKPLTKA